MTIQATQRARHEPGIINYYYNYSNQLDLRTNFIKTAYRISYEFLLLENNTFLQEISRRRKRCYFQSVVSIMNEVVAINIKNHCCNLKTVIIFDGNPWTRGPYRREFAIDGRTTRYKMNVCRTTRVTCCVLCSSTV